MRHVETRVSRARTASLKQIAITAPDPSRVGVVFQEASLFPWLSAIDNTEFPLALRGDPRDEVAAGALRIAIPGRLTTANFLCGLAFPKAQDKTPIVFSDIEPAVLDGRFDAGLIIHENRFTYEAKGLKKIIDLGEFWESETGAPIPLGGIVVRRAAAGAVQQALKRVMRRSVEFAFAHPEASLPYVRAHAQEMSEEVMYKHIDLYVNRYSRDLGPEGRRAIELMFDRADGLGIIPKLNAPLLLA